MAKSINQVLLMGNLTRNPEVRTTKSGQNVTQFALALNRSYKDANDQWQEATDYIDVVAWGKLGEQVAERLTVGSRALVAGRFQSSSWDDNGIKKTKIEVLATDVTFLDAAERIPVTQG